MSWDPNLTELQKLLADLYQEDADIRRVVEQSGIPSEHIDLNGKAISIWHRIIVEAQKRGKIPSIIEIAQDDYPERAASFGWTAEEVTSPGTSSETKLFNIPKWMISSFIGREAELDKMEELFRQYQQGITPFFLVISGKGGIGKTKLADYFAIREKDKICGNIYKININSLDIKTGIRKLAGFFDLDQREEIDNQIQKCLQQIPPDSILIIDNVGKYDGFEMLMGIQSKVFVILTTQSNVLSPFRELGNAGNEQIQLIEFNDNECEEFFRNYVKPEVKQKFYLEGYHLTDFLTQKDQRSPFFIKLICHLIEEIYFESEEADIHGIKERIDQEFKKADTVTERLCKFPFERVSENTVGRDLLFASTLFASGNMPLLEVLMTAGIDFQDKAEPIKLCQKWDLISRVFTEGGREYFVMHDIFRAFISRRFEREAKEVKSQFNQRFILAWLNFLINNQNFQELWGMHENIHSAIRLYCLIEEDSALSNTVRALDSSHLEILEKILPPKQRNRFLFRILENETDLEKIAHIQRGLATSFLRLGRFILAENFAKQSLANFEKLQNEEFQASLLRRLGNIYRSTGSYKESIQSCKKALEMFRKQRDLLAYADVQRQLAQTYVEMGILRKAQDLLIDSISILENLIHKQGPNPNIRNSLAYTLTTLGDTQLLLGDHIGAMQSVERARSIHEQEVGPDHFFVAYDLRYLAKIEIQLHQYKAALSHLAEALKINQKFSGESPNVAFIYLMMAEAHLKAGDCSAAQRNAEKASKIYRRETGKNNQFIAYTDRILAEVNLHQGRLSEAENLIQEAYQILEEKYSDSRHMSEVKFVLGLIYLQRDKVAEAEAVFWQVRSDFIRFSMPDKIKEIDRYLLQALLRKGIDDWDDSVSSYVKYLKDFPASLHNTLGQRLVDLLQEEIRIDANETPTVLDVFCGTGFVSQHLKDELPSKALIAGVDGSKLMIEAARKWQARQDKQIFRFHALPNECGALSSLGKFKYLTLHMGISQIDLRSRHFLFQRLLPGLTEDCTVILSTYAPDYRFSANTEAAIPSINQNNPFKQTLFERFSEIDYEPGDYNRSIAPIFTKEDWHSLACFFEFYGFEMDPAQEQFDNILCVERSWKDRVEFTRIPIISKKVFGEIISEDKWSQIGNVPNYSDLTYGIVIKAKRVKKFDQSPLLFSHVDIDLRNGKPIHYAVAVRLKNRAGKTLFLKRGKGARDFRGSWSLASTFADEGSGLLGSLYESLERNLGILPEHLSVLTPRSIRFNPRKDETGGEWTMAMCLFEGSYDGKLELKSDKYQTFVWEDGPEFVNTLNSSEMGDCTKSYRDLIRCGELD